MTCQGHCIFLGREVFFEAIEWSLHRWGFDDDRRWTRMAVAGFDDAAREQTQHEEEHGGAPVDAGEAGDGRGGVHAT